MKALRAKLPIVPIYTRWPWKYSCATLFALASVVGASDGLQPWERWGQLPEKVTGRSMGARGMYWYAFEDPWTECGTNVRTLYAEIGPDGSVGPWLPTTDRTMCRFAFSAVATHTHMYVVGGTTGHTFGSNTTVVEYAALNDDGSLGPWTRTSPLNHARESFGLVVTGDWMYVLGGTIASAGFGAGRITEYAPINAADGSVGPWQLGPQLNERHPGCAAAAVGGYVYVFAGGVHGYLTNTVERAAINADGSLGGWEYDTPVPEYRTQMGIAVFGNTIYLAGGYGAPYGHGHLTSVIFSSVQPDHTLGSWIQTESLVQTAPSARLTRLGNHVFATRELRDIEHSTMSRGPVCDAGEAYTAQCGGISTDVPLDGSGSSDPDDDPLTFLWTTDCPGGTFDDETSDMPILTVDTAPGCEVNCNVTLTVDDGKDGTDTCSTTVTISGSPTIPTISEWGMAVLGLLLLAGLTLVFRARRTTVG